MVTGHGLNGVSIKDAANDSSIIHGGCRYLTDRGAELRMMFLLLRASGTTLTVGAKVS